VETISCKHHERIEEFHNFALGICAQCGQVRRYDRLDVKQPPKVIKIGRLNGMPTLEHPPKEVIEVVQNKPETDSIAQDATAPARTPRKYKARKPRRDYEADKEAIVEDYDTLTLKEFFAKQHISSDAWAKLKKKWGVTGRMPHKDSSLKGNLVSLGTYEVVEDKGLPPFPPFNDSWPMLTQISWLETYAKITEGKN